MSCLFVTLTDSDLDTYATHIHLLNKMSNTRS